MSAFLDTIQRGDRASQPLATTVVIGTLYFVTDDNVIERSDGTVWESFSSTGGAFNLTQKLTTTNRITNVLAADATLIVAMLANLTYEVKMRIKFTGSTADDFKFRVTGPAAPTLVRIVRRTIEPNTTTLVVAILEAYDAADVNLACTGGQVGWIELDITVENGANAGNLAFEWSNQNGGGGTSSVYKGSYLEYRSIP